MAVRVDITLQYVPLLNLSTYYLKQNCPRDALLRLKRLLSAYPKHQDNCSAVYDDQLAAPVYYNTGIAYLQLCDNQRAV